VNPTADATYRGINGVCRVWWGAERVGGTWEV